MTQSRAYIALGWVLHGSLQTMAWAQTPLEETIEPASVHLPSVPAVDWFWMEKYGVRWSTAKRDPLRRALHAHGVKPLREDSRYWVDIYEGQALIPGAGQLYVGYTAATQQWVFAEYAFPNFMDNSHTQQMVNRVMAQYGPPYETAGQTDMGAYTARWRLSDGLHIQVVREWPETSTYLKFFNPDAHMEMKAELEQEFSKRQKSKLAEGASTRSKTTTPGQ